MKLSFHVDWYERGDTYHFTHTFEQWWETELEKRIPDSKEFAKKHGKSWGLALAFRAPKGARKPSLLGPVDEPGYKWREWCIVLPSFRYKSPDSKAYVPLLRQFLQQVGIVLEREQIDPTKLRKDSELLLKRFASKRGMLEYDDLDDFIAAETKKEGDKASDSGKALKADSLINERLKALRRKYKLKFGVAFDATAKQRRDKGWLTDYAVIDFTVALPSKKGVIPDDLYRAAIEIFRHAEKILKRNRTFFLFRIVPNLKKQAWSWSLALLLTARDLSGTHALVRKTAAELLSLLVGNASFKKCYSGFAHGLCAYSHRSKRLFAIPVEVPLTFSDYYRDSEEVEQTLMSDKGGENMIRWSGVYLGNVDFWFRRYREAIKRWQQAVDTGEPEALMNIACGYTALGDMQKAFQFCKRGLERGAPRSRLNEPELAQFRRHPLFAKLKQTRKKRHAPPAKPLSPKWTMPKNVEELVEQNDGMWVDERWNPILLWVMSDVSSRGRKIPLTWQLQFDPYVKPFKAAGKRLIEARGVEPDGHAWTNLIEREFTRCHRELADELNSDSEIGTWVMQVGSEETCKKLLELVWSLVHAGK
jgi:hypothetical protein